MAKTETTSLRSKKTGQFVLKEADRSGPAAKSVAGSTLTQNPKKASAGSQRVIKGVSGEYRDALKRLVDR